MYVQGVSTRKVAAITEKLCGFEVSSSDVSRAAAELDETLQAWRERPLGMMPYVTLDARYEKVRHGGSVISAAVLIARGVLPNGKRTILGVSVSLSEAEVHWRTFLQSLHARGMHGIQLFTSDSHAGLKKALEAVFPTVPWQRCQFHLQQNAQAYVPKKSMQPEVSSILRSVFLAPDELEAKRLLGNAVKKYETKAPELSSWMEQNVPESLTVFAFPEAHRPKLRTTNDLERVNREIKRRTQVASLFPNTASCLRLVSAVLMELSEDWETSDLGGPQR